MLVSEAEDLAGMWVLGCPSAHEHLPGKRHSNPKGTGRSGGQWTRGSQHNLILCLEWANALDQMMPRPVYPNYASNGCPHPGPSSGARALPRGDVISQVPDINCRQEVARASPLMPGIFIERDYAVSVASNVGRFLDRFAAPCAQTEKSSGRAIGTEGERRSCRNNRLGQGRRARGRQSSPRRRCGRLVAQSIFRGNSLYQRKNGCCEGAPLQSEPAGSTSDFVRPSAMRVPTAL